MFKKDNIYFRSWNFEKEGQLWQKLVKVQYWKNQLPDGQRTNSNIVSKAAFDKSRNKHEVSQFILETRRAELVHLFSILLVIVFLNSSKSIKIIILIYVIVANVPCIIVQRYNRHKLVLIYSKMLNRKGD
ncbi:glycosyl-4,4'-diaponeurosporenoate acyltransferase CrtO family protein [Staphylococcus xylosus]|uniref:glycosyl-4,4'-diaponeurosporenoate acyltransferase CrtO family protein n=1 Tax=Staphylococcus xylosus TaxID=1288 RepID=UPI002DBD143C|nr:glycosyl-4,4'-diaponeurosporenoate acyltransferase [Staphylococcus xylosus]MEB6230926.1 glycosyl-4,4'-diaponeurosporenoate acyltransferase [Staphylococcus xylosus]MEB6246593.1 glycosyl-4,4'-diaponeurosporenoate acyltransferase [Staphylococcus xylosus]MEB7768008.1 glycosyl-4,4'-diaponeurosporenoate acyltransferase [Staphylococcus xylosus]